MVDVIGKKLKNVKFNLEKNSIHLAYSIDEYDRCQIDSILYLKSYNRITDKEWDEIFNNLNYYKTQEMIVHKESIKHTRKHI